MPFLTSSNKEDASGILVLPALAVDARQPRGTPAALRDVLPNCLPFWDWFGELLIPGFVGDRSGPTLAIVRDVSGADAIANLPVGVRFSLEIGMGNG